MAINITLIAPEIPQNTGNIIRLCANTGVRLNLIKPLGFNLDDTNLRRASLDYRDLADVFLYESWQDFVSSSNAPNIYVTVPDAKTSYNEISFTDGDAVLFGSESSGIPVSVLSEIPQENHFKIPMVPFNRSINLSNAVAVVVYESWRQLGFEGQALTHKKKDDYFT